MELDFFGYLQSILIIKKLIIRCLFSCTVTEKNMKPHNSNRFREVLCSGLMINDVIPSVWEIWLQELLKTLEQINIQHKWQSNEVYCSVQHIMTIFIHIISLQRFEHFLNSEWIFTEEKVTIMIVSSQIQKSTESKQRKGY